MLLRLIILTIATVASFGNLSAQDNLTTEYIVERYIEAMGGRSSLHGIKSVRLSCTVSYPNGLTNRIVVLKRKPNRVRISIDTGATKIVQSYNGELAWIAVQESRGTYYTPMKGVEKNTFIREAPLENALIDQSHSGAIVTRIEDIELNRVTYFQLKATFPSGDYTVFLIDKVNFTERRISEYSSDGELLTELIPGKFEKHGGVLFAMQIIRLHEGERVSTLLYRSS